VGYDFCIEHPRCCSDPHDESAVPTSEQIGQAVALLESNPYLGEVLKDRGGAYCTLVIPRDAGLTEARGAIEVIWETFRQVERSTGLAVFDTYLARVLDLDRDFETVRFNATADPPAKTAPVGTRPWWRFW
jgi:hypothetical protein